MNFLYYKYENMVVFKNVFAHYFNMKKKLKFSFVKILYIFEKK